MKKISSIILALLFIIQSNYIFTMNPDTQDEINKEQKKDTEIDSEVLYQMGLEFLNKDQNEQAFKLIESAAKKNHLKAQIELTYMLFDGRGCKINLVGALNICQLVRESSDELANKAYQNYDDKKEKKYNDIYMEFDNLWKKIMTKLLTEDMKIANLISKLDLSEKKVTEEKPMSDEVKRMYC